MEKICKIILIFLLLLFGSLSVNAATLSFSPSTTSRNVGNTFSVTVYVSSPDKAINASSGVVSFPADKLEVTNISKTNSIINLWVQEPSFSNTQGKVNFGGIALNPGYIGSKGTIVTITFKAKSAGQANINFSSSYVLANDGVGTNILDELGTASFSIKATDSSIPDIFSGVGTVDSSISIITSVTHPDQAKWYSNNTPEFSWDLPKNALEVRTLIGKSSTSVPTVRYMPPISQKKVNTLRDGTYYFSLQIRTAEGWSEIKHYRVNIDTKPPNPFSITFPHGAKSLEPQPVILFDTTDNESGISKYDVKVGSGGPTRVAPSATSNPYPLPEQYPGTYTVTVTASDEAGNTRSASEDFTIESIEAPIITFYQEEVESGNSIKIRGTTYSDSDVTIVFKQDEKVISEEHTRSNSSGDFAFFLGKNIDKGIYTFTARVTDGRGAKSNETAPLTIVVNSKFLSNLIDLVLNYLSAAILILLILALVVAGGGYLWYHSLGIIRRLRKESREAEKVLEKSFNILHKDINEHITRLKTAKSKRKLSAEEVSFLEHFEKELAEAKDVIAKEVEDISHS